MAMASSIWRWRTLMSDTVSILLGTGTGSFGAKTDFATGSGPVSVAVGDFNGDGKLDLAVANASWQHRLDSAGHGHGQLWGEDRLRHWHSFHAQSRWAISMAMASSIWRWRTLMSDTVSILLGTGTGSFGAKTDFGTGSVPVSVAVGDFNGDGKLDLAVANMVATPSRFCWARARAALGRRPTSARAASPDSVAVGDFNGDGKLDLAVANVR